MLEKMKKQTDFTNLKAVLLNCSLKPTKSESHTQLLMNRLAGIMTREGVFVDELYALDYKIAFGMVKDGKESGLQDDWPDLHKKIMNADILVMGSPIWLGNKSSV